MTDTCTISPTCERGRHKPDAFPCGGPFIKAGDPCQFCGQTLTADSAGMPVSCPDCWRPITIADMKAIAAEAGLETIVSVRDGR